MRTYKPAWKRTGRGKAHLLAADTQQFGHDGDPKTLCGRKAGKINSYSFDDDPRCKRCERERIKVRASLAEGHTIVILEERTFAGVVSGAFHYTGSLCLGDLPSVDLSYAMTHLQARAENARDPSYDGWEAGAITNRFHSRAALRKHALKVWRNEEHFPQGSALFAASHRATCSPCEVLALDNKQLRSKLNGIYERWEKLPDYTEAVYTEWNLALEQGGLA